MQVLKFCKISYGVDTLLVHVMLNDLFYPHPYLVSNLTLFNLVLKVLTVSPQKCYNCSIKKDER